MPPIKKTKLSDVVVEEVLKAVENGRFKPGQKIPSEKVLTKEFGVSRTTLREAFQKLELLGKMSIRQGDGTYVNDDTPSASFYTHLNRALAIGDTAFTQFLEARECLESYACQLAANRATDTDVDKLNNIIRQQETAVNNPDDFAEYDFFFHQALVEASKNPIILEFWTSIMALIREEQGRITLIPGIMEQALKGHKRIIKAITQKDDKKAQTFLQEHLSLLPGVMLSELSSRVNP